MRQLRKYVRPDCRCFPPNDFELALPLTCVDPSFPSKAMSRKKACKLLQNPVPANTFILVRTPSIHPAVNTLVLRVLSAFSLLQYHNHNEVNRSIVSLLPCCIGCRFHQAAWSCLRTTTIPAVLSQDRSCSPGPIPYCTDRPLQRIG